MALGLQEPPPPQLAPSASDLSDGGAGWEDARVELRPRWPLTTHMHPGIAAAAAARAASGSHRTRQLWEAAVAEGAEAEGRSWRKTRQHTSLTELTAGALSAGGAGGAVEAEAGTAQDGGAAV